MAKRKDYEVGYRKPPREHQFQPGQSGNKKGRPKGARSFATELKEVAELPVHFNEGGKRRKVSTSKAVLLRLREKALKGDQRAIDRYLAMVAGASGPSEIQSTIEQLSEEDRLILAAYEAGLAKTGGDDEDK